MIRLVAPDLVGNLADILEAPTRRRLVVAMVGSVCVAMLDTVAIGLVLPLVDVATGRSPTTGVAALAADVFGTNDPAQLTTFLAIAVVVLFVLKNVGSLAFNWWLLGFVFFERVKTSARILAYYLSAPYTEISRRSSAELMRTMDAAVLQVFSLTISGLMTSFAGLVSVLAVVLALLLVAPLPTLALIAYFAVAAGLYLRLVKPKAMNAGKVMNVASVAGWKAAFAALGALKEVSLRGSQSTFVEAYREAQLAGSRAGRVAAVLGSLPRYILEVLFILAVGVVLAVGAVDQDSGSAGTLSVLAVFVTAGFRLLPAITSLVSSASNIRVGADSVDLVRSEVLRARSHRTEPRAEVTALPFREDLTIRGVSFRYPDTEVDVLRDVNLTIPFGTSLAVVGGSGAGKTTLIDCILGLHEPATGSILADGTDVRQHLAPWRANIAYVPQETYILDASLLQNIGFDEAPDLVDRSRAEQAVDKARLRELVDSLPSGLDSEVGERGGLLSGGQRQRLGIARALYRTPRLLVLDEATSALDNETEHEIGRSLRELAGDVTVIVVAHRLSTVRNVDRIVFLKDGTVSAEGTFEELRGASPDFERLVQLGSLDTPSPA